MNIKHNKDDADDSNNELPDKCQIDLNLLFPSCVRYVNALRTKSTVYKEKRAELSELRAESGVLARTCEVINRHIWMGELKCISGNIRC